MSRWARLRTIYGYFARDVRKRRPKLVAGAAFAVVYALARVIEPWPLKVVFDQVLFHKPAHGVLLEPFTLLGRSPYSMLVAAGLILTLAGLVRGVAYYYEDYLLSSAAQEIVYSVRSRLYRHLHRLPLGFHQRQRRGDLLVRLSTDISLLRDVLIDATVDLGTGAVLVLLMLAVMFAVDPVLTAIALGVMPLIALLSAVYGPRLRSTARQQRKREGQVSAAMHEALAAIDVVQLHGAAEREHARFQQLNKRSLKQGTQSVRLEARMNQSVELALAAGTVVILWAGTLRALHGAITPGELIVFVSYLRAAYRPLRRGSKSVQRSAKALAAAERIVEILETPSELAERADAQPAPPLAGRVAFEEVDFAYGEGPLVLENVSLEIEPGRALAIVGETGSGKSTLIGLVPRLFDPRAGRICVDGIDVRELTLESLRAQISVVRQESVLFGLSIAENIRYGRPDASDEEVRAAAVAAGVDRFVDELPNGYDTALSERGASLSGGQRQRVALARALIRRSPILILDEPTTGLDPATRDEVVEAIEQLTRGTTTLLVTHDLALARRADEIAVLDRGRLVARGSYEDLLAHSPRFQRLLSGDVPPSTRRAPTRSGGGPRILFYSHNGVGMGHLQRQLDLARAYRARHPDAAVLLASGSRAAPMFELPSGIDLLKLPSLLMVDRYRTWEPRDLALPRTEVSALRRELLEQATRRFSPDLLVADFMPAGPYGELLPALEQLGRIGARAIAGFRDVIDAPEFVRVLWEETGVYDVLRRHYDTICVYGDPSMVDFATAYGLDDALVARLRYCGYLGRPPFEVYGAFERPFVLATCGGGADGASVLEAFVRAAEPLARERGGTWLAVSGPLLPAGDHSRLVRLGEAKGISVRRSLPDLRSYVAAADCVVAMPGYNTVCDVLSFRRPAVLLPRQQPSEEQLLRAQRLEEWGLAQVVLERDPTTLAAAIERALAGPPPARAPVPLDGTQRALDTFDRALRIATAA